MATCLKKWASSCSVYIIIFGFNVVCIVTIKGLTLMGFVTQRTGVHHLRGSFRSITYWGCCGILPDQNCQLQQYAGPACIQLPLLYIVTAKNLHLASVVDQHGRRGWFGFVEIMQKQNVKGQFQKNSTVQLLSICCCLFLNKGPQTCLTFSNTLSKYKDYLNVPFVELVK